MNSNPKLNLAPWRQKYLKRKRFDYEKYLNEVHISLTVKNLFPNERKLLPKLPKLTELKENMEEIEMFEERITQVGLMALRAKKT